MERLLLQLFASADRDKDGRLSPAELCGLLAEAAGAQDASAVAPESPRVQKLLHDLDADGDGALSLAELAKPSHVELLKTYLREIAPAAAKTAAKAARQQPLSDEELAQARALFAKADTDSDGSVSLGSAATVMAALGWSDPAAAGDLFAKVGKKPGEGISFVELLRGFSVVAPRKQSQQSQQRPMNPLAAVAHVSDESGDESSDEDKDKDEEEEKRHSQSPPPPPPPMPPRLALGAIADHPSNPSAAFAAGNGGDGRLHRRQNSRVLSMTNRRQTLDTELYLQRQADVFAWLSRALGRDVADFEQLTDGVLLCELANMVRRGSATYNARPTGLFSKLGNAQAFTEAAEAFGVPEPSLFAASDLVQRANLPMVFVTLDLFAKAVSKEPYSFPVRYEPAATPGKFSRAQTTAVELQTAATARRLSAHAREQLILNEHKLQVKQYQERVSTLETQLSATQSSVKSRVEEYERRLSEMKQHTEVVHAEVTDLRQRLETVQEERSQLVVRAEKAERQLEAIAPAPKKKEEDEEEEDEDWDAEFAATPAPTSVKPAPTESREQELLRRIAELERMLAELQSKYDALLAAKKGEAAGSQVEQLQEDLAEREADLEEAHEKAKKLKELVNKLRADIDAKNLFAEKEALRLQEELSGQQDKAKKQVVAVEQLLVKEREEHKAELAALRAELNKLKHSAGAPQPPPPAASEPHGSSSAKLKEATARIRELEEQLRRSSAEKVAFDRDLEKLRKEIAVLEKRKPKLSAATAVAAAAPREDAKLSRELKEARKALKESAERESLLRAEVEQLAQAFAREKREHESAAAEVRRLRQAAVAQTPRARVEAPPVEHLPEMDFSRPKEQDHTLDSLERRYLRRIGSLNEELAKAKADADDLKKRIRVLESGARHPADLAATQRISKDADRWAATADHLAIENAQLKERLQKKREEVLRLKSELSACRSSLAAATRERSAPILHSRSRPTTSTAPKMH